MAQTELQQRKIGHKTLRLRDLMPEKSVSYSPNLYRWLRKKGHFFSDGGVLQSVFSVKAGTRSAESFGAGTLLIGYRCCDVDRNPVDKDFIGVRLMAALCRGGKADSCCYAGIAGDLVEVTGFWDRYLVVGRCAIDPEHEEYFSGADRYAIAGEVRTCLWCGVKHRKELQSRMIHDEIWILESRLKGSI